jgi:hypothetical protein
MSNLANYIQTLGVSSHWRLNEDGSPLASDASGGRHALWNSIPTKLDGLASGDTDGAKQLSANRAVATGGAIALTDNFTVCAVVGSVGQNQYGTIIYNGSNSNGWGLVVSDGDPSASGTGRIITVILNGITFSVFGVDRRLFPDCNYLLTVVRRSGTWELWINDMLEESVVGSAPTSPTGNITIGDNPAGGSYFNGVVDELAIFPSALSAAQILTLTKLVFMQPPATPEFSVAPGEDGFDEFTLVSAATSASFPVAGYAIWEGDASDEDGFDFSRPPRETITTSGSFSPRRSAVGKHYAIRAFDDRTIPNFGPPQIVASVGVPVDASSETVTAIKADPAAILAEFKNDPDFGTTGLLADAASAASEVVKIPRASGVLAAGSSVRRTKVNITTTTLDEILDDTP